ncbi:ATP-binding protein [Pseudonocardia humida]|uniref:AAA family ATPase n=1 Tax=Pseudonocardia humida TaxID=2800819 RepID=A0ABT1AAF8_9PSEU|nr:LuxR family transcriptional regulator [Pseudonocardia humida]MCO1659936.1 AAA family ATPase [Pseudonocardia humida]
MAGGRLRTGLRGRRRECEALDRLLEDVRAGQSRVLVVRGEAGVGKSALLAHLRARASGCRIARAAGVESEMELAFAGLHQLCAPMLDHLERLPAPQREALGTAFGLTAGPAPDRFLVGLAVLGLISEVAEREPLLCEIDDAQWLDRASAQVLAFVARRLLAESAAMVFAVRSGSGGHEHPDHPELAGLPELAVGGLTDRDANALLDQAIRGRLDERVRDRIVAEARGNPLALLELPRELTPAELAGGFGLPAALPAALPLAGRIEQSFLRRLGSLPPDTQRLLLVAAAEPVGDAALLRRAADRLRIAPDAATPAVGEGLVEFGVHVRFRHPLVRSAVYRAATPDERRAAHRALAEATDSETDLDRRAWHRAQAAVGPDDEVAEELLRTAGRAQARGGVAATAAFLERAAALTADAALQGARALAAAQAKLEAGAPDAARTLAATAGLAPLDELRRALLQRLRAQIAFALGNGGEAPPLLLDAAARLVPLDVGLARQTCLEALAAGIFTGRLGDGRDARTIARTATTASQPPGATDLLLDGLATRVTEGYAASVPILRSALAAFRDDDLPADAQRWLWLACRVAADLWDHETWDELSRRGVRLARDAGALDVLPTAAQYRAGAHVHAGEYDAASVLMEEAAAITHATGTASLADPSGMLPAYRGHEAEALVLIEAARREATARGQGMALSLNECAHAVLCNGLGRYGDALAAAERACAQAELSLYGLALVELVEAAVRCDAGRLAASALERLCARTGASGSDWALGIEARSRGLATTGPSAEVHYREAIERLSRGRLVPHLARAHLVYGEWLRRENRRSEAREQLRTAHGMLDRIGAEAFAERARRELAATGERVRRQTVDSYDELTSQELQIARLAGRGRTNPQIGAELFLSPRTVEWHLHNVFAKLGITSRRALAKALPDRGRLVAASRSAPSG